MPTKIFLDPWLPCDINFGLLYARGHRFLNGHLTRCIASICLCRCCLFLCGWDQWYQVLWCCILYVMLALSDVGAPETRYCQCILIAYGRVAPRLRRFRPRIPSSYVAVWSLLSGLTVVASVTLDSDDVRSFRVTVVIVRRLHRPATLMVPISTHVTCNPVNLSWPINVSWWVHSSTFNAPVVGKFSVNTPWSGQALR